MNDFYPLIKREWLQHRFAWALMAVLPITLALLVLSVGNINVEQRDPTEPLPVALALASLAGTTGVYLIMTCIASLIIVAAIARRDHGDRSIEFWLSLPTGHGRSLGVPLLVHLIAVPVAALGVGLVGGLLVSLLLVTRVEGLNAWMALPWPSLLAAALSVAARLALGLVLATLWLAPLIGLLVLLSAWLGRWGLVVLVLGLGLGSQVLDKLLGQPHLGQWLAKVLSNAATGLVHGASQGGVVIENARDVQSMLGNMPRLAFNDAQGSLGELASPLFAGGLLLAAGCFALLVLWRSRGAGSGS